MFGGVLGRMDAFDAWQVRDYVDMVVRLKGFMWLMMEEFEKRRVGG